MQNRGDNMLAIIGCEGNPSTLIARAFRQLDKVDTSWAHREFHRLCKTYGHPADGPLWCGEDFTFTDACEDLKDHGWFLHDWGTHPPMLTSLVGSKGPHIVIAFHTLVPEVKAVARFDSEMEATEFANDLELSGLWFTLVAAVVK